jgi:hypothetical protein
MYDPAVAVSLDTPRRVVLTGRPGSGKRTAAGLLEGEHGFTLLGCRTDALDSVLVALGSLGHDAVTTWSASLAPRGVELADALGIELVWLRSSPEEDPPAPIRVVDAVEPFGAARSGRAGHRERRDERQTGV